MNRQSGVTSQRNPAVTVAAFFASRRSLIGAVVSMAVWIPSHSADGQAWVRQDAAAIETAEACGECHISEFEVWRRTPHSTGFKTLHRKASAEAIAKKLGFPLVKRDSLCIGCHYTPRLEDGDQLRAASGVSCESCHGPGRDWINVHNDYGGKGLDHRSETPEHRAARIEASRRAGMRRPSDLYELASSCFGCHTVPHEELVNVGGHSTGSGNFELVEWTQGIIRHNFLNSFLEGDGTENVESSIERRRVMYIVGRALELEHAFRGAAIAEQQGIYLKAMIRRVRIATSELRAISLRTEIPELAQMVAAARQARVTLGNEAQLLEAADAIGSATRAFLATEPRGENLSVVDPLMLGIADDFELASHEPLTSTDPESTTGSPPGGSVAAVDSTPTGSAGQGTVPNQITTPAVSAIPAVGEKKQRIRSRRSAHETLGPGACSECHAEANAWWFDDRHFTSADPFFALDPENVRIATLYGLRPESIARGDVVCMDCHGSVISGRETREVNDGVGCESCHGPAKDYREPHQEGDKSLGLDRPGYRRALELGMVELQNLQTRSEVCSGCHYITDQRLLSSGHPSGAGFDYVAAMTEIKHWQHPVAERAPLQAAFNRVIKERGPVPEVRLARRASAAGGPGVQPATESSGVTQSASQITRSPKPNSPRNFTRPFRGAQTETTGEVSSNDGSGPEIVVPEFSERGLGSSIEESLLSIKQQLELLYRLIKEGEN